MSASTAPSVFRKNGANLPNRDLLEPDNAACSFIVYPRRASQAQNSIFQIGPVFQPSQAVTIPYVRRSVDISAIQKIFGQVEKRAGVGQALDHFADVHHSKAMIEFDRDFSGALAETPVCFLPCRRSWDGHDCSGSMAFAPLPRVD